jgi:hypothetical protein
MVAIIATISLSDDNWVVLDTPPWRYYAEKYNAEMKIEPVQCPVGQDLVKYLANRERSRERSQSNPRRITLYGAGSERISTKSTFTTSCGQDFRRRGGGGFPSRPVRP